MPGPERVFEVPDEAAMGALGTRLGAHLNAPLRVYLRGPLGAGKTTLVRGLLRGFGHAGAVRSPTYTLLETYETPRGQACHLDLYRLQSPLELDDFGARDYLDGDYCCFVEWPERGVGALPEPDLAVEITPGAGGAGRRVRCGAGSAAGARIVQEMPS